LAAIPMKFYYSPITLIEFPFTTSCQTKAKVTAQKFRWHCCTGHNNNTSQAKKDGDASLSWVFLRSVKIPETHALMASAAINHLSFFASGGADASAPCPLLPTVAAAAAAFLPRFPAAVAAAAAAAAGWPSSRRATGALFSTPSSPSTCSSAYLQVQTRQGEHGR
jgi:hypothetical protein